MSYVTEKEIFRMTVIKGSKVTIVLFVFIFFPRLEMILVLAS